MRHGITDALRWHGGFDNIHPLSTKRRWENFTEFNIRKIEMNTDKSFQCKTMGLASSPNEFHF